MLNVKANDEGQTPLHYAVENGNVELAKLLLAKGCMANAQNNNKETPLHLLCKQPHSEEALLSALLKKGADINALDNDGNTPLHNAVAMGNEKTIACLTERGAHSTIQNNKDETAKKREEETPKTKTIEKAKPLVSEEGKKDSVTTTESAHNAQKQSSLFNPFNVGLAAVSLAALAGALSWFYKKSKKADHENTNAALGSDQEI